MSSAIQSYIDDDGRKIVYGYAEEVSIQEHATLEVWREHKKKQEFIKRGPSPHYVNCYHEPVAELNAVLSVNELGAIMKLIPYIRINTDGALYYEGTRMSVDHIAKAIGRGVRHTKTIVATLHREGVLWRVKDGRSYVYGVEGRYHSMGYVIEGAKFTKVLQVKTRTDIRNLTIQAAGVLYKMLPFFNYEHFYLCTNPNEKEEDLIFPLSHREFAELVGVDRSVIDSGVRELMRYGFIGRFTASNGDIYVVNPDVASRRKNLYDENSERVRSMFRMVERQGVSVKKSELPF